MKNLFVLSQESRLTLIAAALACMCIAAFSVVAGYTAPGSADMVTFAGLVVGGSFALLAMPLLITAGMLVSSLVAKPAVAVVGQR